MFLPLGALCNERQQYEERSHYQERRVLRLAYGAAPVSTGTSGCDCGQPVPAQD